MDKQNEPLDYLDGWETDVTNAIQRIASNPADQDPKELLLARFRTLHTVVRNLQLAVWQLGLDARNR